MPRLHSTLPLALIGAFALAGCTALHHSPGETVGSAVSTEGKGAPAETGTPTLSDLYPSLGDEEAAAPPSELDQEAQAEEQFIGNEAIKGPRVDPKRLAAEFDIPIEVTPLVEQFIVYFQTQGREWYATWLARSTRYLPMMKKVFRENGLPEDMTYIAM